METRRIRFQNNLPQYNRLTKNDIHYLEVVKSLYNDPNIQRQFVNSLNVSNASKNRIKNALNVNANYTRNLRNSRRSIVQSMNRGNIPVLQSLFKRHRNIKNMTNELNQYPISQGRKNAITRRLKESMGRQRFGEEDSHTIARLLAESDDPIVILKRIRELPVSPEKQRKFMRHILYVFDGAVPPQEYMKFKNVYEHAMREGVNSPMLESLLSESGAFD